MISYKNIALQIISYSNQAAYNCYLGLLPNGVTEQTRRHTSNMTSLLACIAHELANFATNFVAMAMGVGRKNAIGSIRWPIPENPPIGAKMSQKSHAQA